MKTTVKIDFTEMKKNSKHQVMKFTFKGEDSEAKGETLYQMSGGIVLAEISGCDIGRFNADFFEHKKTHNGFVIQLKIKGDVKDTEAGKIYAMSGRSVELTLEQAQISIEEFYNNETPEDDDPDQMSLDVDDEEEGE